MTTKLEKIRARVDNPPHWCEYAGLGLDADIPALLAVVEAARDWRDAIERFKNILIPMGDTRAKANEAQERLYAALAAIEGEE